MPRYWPGCQRYHGIRTTLGQHCSAECRLALRDVYSPNSDRHFFVVLERDSSDLLSVESLSCLVSPAFGLPFFGNHVQVLYDAVVDFLHKVLVHRRDVAERGWRSWMLEDDKVHPYRWLKPDLVAPAPFLCCDPGLTIDGSGGYLRS